MFATLIPIVRSSNLYLVPHGVGNDRRLAECFRDTWKKKKLPLADRRLMVKHWREDQSPAKCMVQVVQPKVMRNLNKDAACGPHFLSPSDFLSPKIELLSGWVSGWDDGIVADDDHGEGIGEVFANGHLMRFHASIVDQMPDNVLACLIAHELAHVAIYAVGEEQYLGFKPGDGDHEMAADELAGTYWGFDGELIDEWSANAGITKFIEGKSLEDALRHMFGPGGRYSNESVN